MWLILRTDARKEAYVSRQLQNLGFACWHPVQVIACRPAIARRIMSKTQLKAYREVSILPRRVFVDIRNWPMWRDAIDGVRHVTDAEKDSDGQLARIPAAQIAAFRAAVDAENTAALALSQKASRKQKAKWKSLHDALVEMIDQAKTELEKAA